MSNEVQRNECIRKDWDEFANSGLLWFINTILHTFGWAIVLVKENDLVTDAYPARVTYRGFSHDSNTKGYRRISHYLRDNIDEIVEEAEQD